MKVLVLGGGVVGVATAYYLAEAGFEVTVIDRNEQVASESSYANAGLVAPGDSYAWASPGALKAFLKSLYRQDQGVNVKLRRDPRMWSWFWKFLFECTHERARVNTLCKLRLTLYSRECLNALVSCTGVDYDGNGRGVLYFFRSQKSLDHGAAIMGLLEENGLRTQIVDRDGLAEIDPGLKSATANLAGGTFSPMDQTGDSCKFGRGLAAWCAENQGVEFAYRTAITGIELEGGRVARVVTDQGAFAADAFVLAMGCYSPFLAERIGVRLPVYPVEGYSITVPIQEEPAAPHVGGVDEDRLVAYSRLGNRLRFTATAEVSGYDRSYQPRNCEADVPS